MSVNSADRSGADTLESLRRGAARAGVILDDARLARLAALRDLLLDWNTRVNLTAITDPAAVATLHFLDSLTCALALRPAERARPLALLDVGSGAGFPGLPLAIAFPHWRVTLLEATGKKSRFQEQVIATLGLENARALRGRAEEVAHRAELRGRFDVVTARAVAALPALLEYCLPFARSGGLVIAPKKGDLTEETAVGARAARLLGARLLAPITIDIPPLDDGRVLLVARALRACPAHYPRAGGAPLR
jgi:16S rRNA (guanine527-N7)-methyltransferase